MTKKITVDKNEGIAEVIDRILDEPDDEITLVIPRDSLLVRSARNFALLRREVEAAGKSITIESVDEAALGFASEAGIAGTHPLWKNRGGGSTSDIVAIKPEMARREAPIEEDEPEAARPAKKRPAKQKLAVHVSVPSASEEVSEDEDEPEIEEAEEESETKHSAWAGERFFKERTITQMEDDDEDHKKFSWKWLLVTLVVLVGAAIILTGVTVVFGRATIAINFKKTPWTYAGAFTADTSVSKVDTVNDVIPAQIFNITKNATQLYPATSQQDVSIKAQGILTIYNAYSSAPQTLVATTRFVTPSGQIFRLVNQVVVPGAQVTNGQIVPSSINAQVVADQPGPSYNVGPIAKLTVPGFAGTAKANGFYGAIASSTTGGFTGEKAVASASDIASAKAKMTALLQSDLQSSLTTSYPNNFKILDGATNLQITKITVNTSTDQNGNFSVFGEATLQAIGFDESMLKAFLLSLAQTTEPSSTFSSLDLTYSSGTPNFTSGSLSFSVTAQGSLEPAFSTQDFEAMISGKSVGDARADVAAIPQLNDGSISLWPSWLWNIPANTNKIQVNVN